MWKLAPELRWGTLLVLLIAAILVEPIFGTARSTELTSLALFEVVVVCAILTSATDRTGRIIGAALAVLWFVATVLALYRTSYHGLVAAFSVAMLLAALIVTFRNLLDREAGDFGTLIGGIFGYVLLAVVWAMLFVQIERLQPGAIAFPDDGPIWTSCIYYSLVTLTSLGYGDILPVSPVARIAAGLEAVVGVLYIAVMIGSIVGTYRTSPSRA